jgi:hypothetical protein
MFMTGGVSACDAVAAANSVTPDTVPRMARRKRFMMDLMVRRVKSFINLRSFGGACQKFLISLVKFHNVFLDERGEFVYICRILFLGVCNGR